MRRSPLLQSRTVLVATSFDEQTPGLVAAAADYCRRTDRRLCLLHVLEPFMQRPHSQPFAGNDTLWNTMQAIETSGRQLALGRLRELAETHADGLDVHTLVVPGRRLEILGREALRVGAGLLVVGARRGDGPLGVSTALGLLSSAAVPVLALDGRATRPFPPARPRLLLADDLSDESAAAADAAFELAALLGDATVRHLHVNGVTEEALDCALTAALATSHTPVRPADSVAGVQRALVTGLEASLAARAAAHLGDLGDADCTYVAEVRTGRVLDELAACAAGLDPDLLVFGRHRAIHHQPFFLGRLPFKAMLSLGRPLLVVPND